MLSEWKSKPFDRAAVDAIQEQLQISPLLARLLFTRNVTTPDDARHFLSSEHEAFPDPFLFTEMQAAVDRIRQAIEKDQRILIHGDYDADGVTSTAIVLETLWELGATAESYIPNRLTGSYGLQHEAMASFAEQCDLLITVDCGTTAVDAVKEANRLGLDVIITDHHEPGDERPPAVAVLNPMRPEETYPSKCLSGAGVAWKLACALRRELAGDDDDSAQIELAALGAVADVMPLIGENRLLLKKALPRFGAVDRPGLSALMESAKVLPNQVSAWDIGFRLGPRINAAGRMEDPNIALELLITQDEQRAVELAKTLHQLNQKRQTIERQTVDQACKQIEADGILSRSDKVLFVVGADWQRGVIGLAASRLSQRYGRSTFVLTLEGGEAHGSARALAGQSLVPLLDCARPHAVSCGGHESAAGMRVLAENIEAFEAALYQAADAEWQEPTAPPIWVDAPLPLERIDDAWMKELAQMEPFGQGNEEPVFYARTQLSGYGAKIVGNNHLQASFQHACGIIQSIGFNQGKKLESLPREGEVEILFRCRYEEYQGRRDIRLHLSDIRPAATPAVTQPAPKPTPRPVVKEAPPTTSAPSVQLTGDSTLDRKQLGEIYKLLQNCCADQYTVKSENAWLLAKIQKISQNDFDLALQVFSEIGLLQLNNGEIRLVEAAEKKSLTDSPTFRAIQAKEGAA
ncbi:MAG: single-stranded-DNA-specific exonuclease RecJ [Candidatus Hinthialibacter antarcticus]|nr:single-stranded-DNA-specific exonuclease RecJ [Candidatus Hinthialibacter antarcticus]